MADTKVKRSTLNAQPKRQRLDYRRKSRLYESLYDLNRGFLIVLEVFERLERKGFFRRDYLRAFRNMADELLAKANHVLTATLRDCEQQEAARFGRLCRKWERRFHNPARPAIRKQSNKKAPR